MYRFTAISMVTLFALACGSDSPPVQNPAEPPTAATEAAANPEAASPGDDKEAKRAEKERKVAETLAKFTAEIETERARWTPEVKAAANKLAGKKFRDTRKALAVILASPHRSPENRARDIFRHPVKTLTFFDVKPTSTVVELGPGKAWYTEVLAPLLKNRGKLYVVASDPDAPADSMSRPYGRRFAMFRELSPALYGAIEPVILKRDQPAAFGPPQSADVVLASRELHGWIDNGNLDDLMTAAHAVLKPGGILGIVQHRAPEGADPTQAPKTGYLPQAWVIAQAQKHGFELVATSEINANPKDTKDYPDGVWTLPPTYRLGNTDREKYTAIGESDRMTVKLRKIAKP